MLWFLSYAFSKELLYKQCCSPRNVDVNDEQQKYIYEFIMKDKQEILPDPPRDCCPSYPPIRMEFQYDQIPTNEFKEMIKEVISVPPMPTIAGFKYHYISGKYGGDWVVNVIQTRELPYQSWQPEIMGNIDKLDGKNMYCKLTVYLEYDDDMDEIITPLRQEMIQAVRSTTEEREGANAHAQIIDSSGPPNVIGQSSKSIAVLHKYGMRVLWEILNIFGYQMILDIIWEHYLRGNRHEIIVKKHIYNSDKGRNKAGERDQIIGDRFEQIQATIEKSEDMYSPLL